MPEIIVSNETGQSNDTSKDINEISFVGRMISRNETQGCLTMHFRTTTPRKEGAKPFTNTLTLLCFDDEAKGKIGACRLMETVRVKGYISSSKKRDTEGGEPRRRGGQEQPAATEGFSQTAAQADGQTAAAQPAQNAQPARAAAQWDPEDFEQIFVVTDMETAEGHAADENSLNVTGTVLRARVTRKGSVVFVIRTSGRDAKHRNCLVKATASPYISSDIITMMPAGTRVSIQGHCSGHSIIRDGMVTYVESIVVDGIQRA